MVKSIEIDDAKIPAREAEVLESLVEQATFFQLDDPSEPVLPDEEQYFIRVESQEGSRQLHMNRSGVPAALKSLIKYLAQQATYEKQK